MADATCSIEGCARRVKGKGLCNTHLERLRIHTWASSFVGATPNAVMLRLWRKVPAMLTDEQADRCAVALGLHPSQVWPGWDEAGLSVLDAMFLRSGWRRAWEFEQSESVAVPA